MKKLFSCLTMLALLSFSSSAFAAFPKLGTKALTPASTVAVTMSDAQIFTWTPGEAETVTATGANNTGDIVTFILTADGTSRTITFGTGFHSTGTLATGTDADDLFAVSFRYTGSVWIEIARTTVQEED